MSAGPSPGPVVISHQRRVTLADVAAVAHGARVEVDPDCALMLDSRRAQAVTGIATTGQAAYGFNRGFGHNVDVSVPPERLEQLQQNLVRSHACGVGPAAPREVVRAAMFLRAASLARGHSGVRSRLVLAMADLLNNDITPLVPVFGSVGASGDLAPLAHIALTLIGEGRVLSPDGPAPSAPALAAAGLQPLALEMKEGLALTNGVQFSCAYGVLACQRLDVCLKTAAVATALSCQVLLGSDEPFDPDLHSLRPHPGAVRLARWMHLLMRHSPMRGHHAPHQVDWQVQDPYSMRCAAQVLGACSELLDEARSSLEIEANSVTDNPLLLADAAGRYTRIVSGGHFHGMPVAIRLYGLLQAACMIAQLSNLRCARYVDEDRNRGLGPDLIWPGLSAEDRAASSGMMIPEYVSAALVNWLWGAMTPGHLLSIATDAGQEDHASMSAGLAVRLWEALDRVAEVLAIELAYASQAAAIRRESPSMATKRELDGETRRRTEEARRHYIDALERALADPSMELDIEVRQRALWPEQERVVSPPCAAVLEAVRASVPVVTRDRALSSELQALAGRVASGKVLAAAQALVPLDDG